jgi:predicted Zn finger-like uncharacterized protein
MYTRCPACHTVHAVSAALLAAASGRYRCAKCNKVNNSLDCLFDELPAAGDRPPGAGDLPVLGLHIDLDAAARSRQDPDGIDESGAEIRNPGRRGPARLLLRVAWVSAAVVVLGFVALRLAEFQGWPLADRGYLARIGLLPAQEERPFRDLDNIHLVSREVRSHPLQPGRLRLSATIVNRADRNQKYPAIEVTIQDAAGQTLSSQRFEPSDYLVATTSAAGMPPGAYVPVLLELDDPGEQAVGFELTFR